MELNKIEKLIEKYFDGATSIVEEKELKAYFSSSNVAPNLKQYQSVFGYFNQGKKDIFSRKIQIKSKNKTRIWLSVAATTLVAFGVGSYLYVTTNSTEIKGCNSNDDPKIVMQETQKALNLISSNINTGVKSVAYIKEYKNSKNKIFK